MLPSRRRTSNLHAPPRTRAVGAPSGHPRGGVWRAQGSGAQQWAENWELGLSTV